MSIEEKLELIRAKCLELLSIPRMVVCQTCQGEWRAYGCEICDHNGDIENPFIDKSAEAGWLSTICIIDRIPWLSWEYRQQLENEIISAWEGII